jgi:hypothetical protein
MFGSSFSLAALFFFSLLSSHFDYFLFSLFDYKKKESTALGKGVVLEDKINKTSSRVTCIKADI